MKKVLLFLLLAVACSGLSRPERAAQAALLEYASIPYRNESFTVYSNDGTFATVRIGAETRRSAESDWREQEVYLDCKNISGNWSCDMGFWQDTNSQTSQDLVNAEATQMAIPSPTPACAYVPPDEKFSNGGYSFDNKYLMVLQIPGTIRIPVRGSFNEDVNAIIFQGTAGTTIKIDIEPRAGEEFMLLSPANRVAFMWKSYSVSGDGERVSSVTLECDGTYTLYVYYLREIVTISISIAD